MTDCTVWWASPLDESDGLQWLLSPAESRRYHAYRRSDDQRRFLTGRALAKTVLASRFDVKISEIEFDASCPDCSKQHGRPRLPGSGVQLSISHSGNRVGLAVTDGAPVGLDVESHARNADEAMLAYALNETELAALSGLDAAARAEVFFGYWTRKEAIMKATGRGLRIPLRGITLSAPTEPTRLVTAEEDELDPGSTVLTDLTPGVGYSAAVAVLTSAESRVTELHWDADRELRTRGAREP